MSDESAKQAEAGLEEISLPSLETPASTELAPATQGAVLLDEAAVALNATKLAVSEALLGVLVRNLSYPDFMRELLLLLLKAIKAEAGTIFEADPSGRALFFRAVAGQQSDRLDGAVIPIGRGIVGHVFESRQLACVQDCRNDSRFLKTIDDAVGFETRNLVAAPIIVRGKVFCVVEVLNRIAAPGFSMEDIELIEYFCRFAAKALEARLMLNWAARAPGSGRSEAA